MEIELPTNIAQYSQNYQITYTEEDLSFIFMIIKGDTLTRKLILILNIRSRNTDLNVLLTINQVGTH